MNFSGVKKNANQTSDGTYTMKAETPPNLLDNSPQASNLSKIEILIVDDNIFNLSTLQTMIKMKFGLESITVCSGQLALKSVQQQIALKVDDEPPFKIIFMDCNMP